MKFLVGVLVSIAMVGGAIAADLPGCSVDWFKIMIVALARKPLKKLKTDEHAFWHCSSAGAARR